MVSYYRMKDLRFEKEGVPAMRTNSSVEGMLRKSKQCKDEFGKALGKNNCC
jgi:hypothetical protein